MTEEQKQIIQREILRRYDSLRPEIKNAMISMSSAEAIRDIGRKNSLDKKRTGVLAEEIGYILLGVIDRSNFVDDLTDILEVDKNKASEIAEETTQKIFVPVKDALIETYGQEFWETNSVTDNKQLTTDNERLTTDDRQLTTDNQQPTTPTMPMPPAPPPTLPVSDELTTNNQQPTTPAPFAPIAPPPAPY